MYGVSQPITARMVWDVDSETALRDTHPSERESLTGGSQSVCQKRAFPRRFLEPPAHRPTDSASRCRLVLFPGCHCSWSRHS